MTIDQIINVVVTVTLVEMMLATGLSLRFVDLAGVLRHYRLLFAAVLVNYVCVPAIAIVLLLWVNPHPMVAAGFLTLAVCPGAPYGPPFTAIAKGNVPTAAGLMVLMAGSSALVAPLLLSALLPFASAGKIASVNSLSILATLLGSQLAPLLVGMLIRHLRGDLAKCLERPAKMISVVLNLLALGLILATQYELLLQIRFRGFVAMAALLTASMLIGWYLGGPACGTRKSMAITASIRNAGVGLVIVTGSFPGTPAITAVVAFGFVSIFGTLAWATAVALRCRPDNQL
jgi:bile acid:Na+ symporter, BASS family